MTTEQSDPAVDNFLQMAEALPEAMLVLAADGLILGGNRACGRLLGISPSRIEGKHLHEVASGGGTSCDYLRACARSRQLMPASLVMFPETHGIACRAEGASLRPRSEDKPALIFLRLSGKSAAVEKFLALNHQIKELSTEIHWRKQAQSQLKGALAEKDALLREVHHRVKNNLNVIIALLDMHSADLEDPEVLQVLHEVRNRVYVMARVHQRLYANEDLAQVDLKEFLDELVPEIVRAYQSADQNVSLVLTADPVKADLDAAQACGLIVQELVANAFEHAFPTGGSGTLEVALHKSLDDGEVALRVSDNGIGLPPGFDLATAPTVGMQLVYSFARQMRGSVAVEAENGTTFTISFRG